MNQKVSMISVSTERVGPWVLLWALGHFGCVEPLDTFKLEGAGGMETSVSPTVGAEDLGPDMAGGITAPECGDGVIDETEFCDDGNHNADDLCDADCERGFAPQWTLTFEDPLAERPDQAEICGWTEKDEEDEEENPAFHQEPGQKGGRACWLMRGQWNHFWLPIPEESARRYAIELDIFQPLNRGQVTIWPLGSRASCATPSEGIRAQLSHHAQPSIRILQLHDEMETVLAESNALTAIFGWYTFRVQVDRDRQVAAFFVYGSLVHTTAFHPDLATGQWMAIRAESTGEGQSLAYQACLTQLRLEVQ